jgi:hypothetical protein
VTRLCTAALPSRSRERVAAACSLHEHKLRQRQGEDRGDREARGRTVGSTSIGSTEGHVVVECGLRIVPAHSITTDIYKGSREGTQTCILCRSEDSTCALNYNRHIYRQQGGNANTQCGCTLCRSRCPFSCASDSDQHANGPLGDCPRISLLATGLSYM